MAELSFDFSSLISKPSTIRLSPQQVEILDWVENGDGNGLIIAVAGAGKTSTLIEALSRMNGTVAFAAYNKAISLEVKEKVENRGIGAAVKVGTFHSFGFKAWATAHRNPNVDPNKIYNLVRNYAHKDKTQIPEVMLEFVEKIVSIVRSSGIGIICPINKNDAWNAIIAHHGLDDLLTGKKPWEESDLEPDELQALVDQAKVWSLRILRESIRLAHDENQIDFDDQLYMPLLDSLYIQQYDWVLVDEAQDTNPVRLAFSKAMLAPGGRFLAVGDPMQAIYGFTGADSSSLDSIAHQFGTKQMDLTVSFRCPQDVVLEAQKFSSLIQSADEAPKGRVDALELEDLLVEIAHADNKELEQSAILCRKNAPIVDLAFGLLRAHIPCHVEGRDIGSSIISLASKWKTITKLNQLLPKVEQYRERQVQKFMARGQEMRADAIHDRCDTLRALANGLLDANPEATVIDLKRSVEQMFKNDTKSGLTLASVHRSKGREWETVYILGRSAYMPSPFARQDWQIQQESNLCYVAITRSKHTLIDVSVPTTRGER